MDKGNYAAVGVEHVRDLLARGETFLLVDSRPLSAFLQGAIPSALPIPDSRFEKKAGLLPADKSIPLVFYSNGRECPLSHASALKALALGHTTVRVCEAGYPAWVQVYAGATQALLTVQAAGPEGGIGAEQLRKILAERPDRVALIDVREPDEYAAGHLPAARSVPLGQLEQELKALPADRPVVFVCASGTRACEAFSLAKGLRKDLKEVYYLDAAVKCARDGACEITDNKKR